MTDRIAGWLAELTLTEKVSLCSGQDFWTTKPVERLGIPGWMMTDGPHGLRKQRSGTDTAVLGSVPATCFPSGAGLASSWNRDLIQEVGQAIGREARAAGVGLVLGPAINIKRSPLCGRNFEYLSEDPLLTGEMALHHIQGLQSAGVGASLKHFAANNQERLRMAIDVQVDERTLREIYLAGFERAITGAQPWTVMCAYNRLNGTYVSEHPWLLSRVLRDEWGFTGLVVTDWGACHGRVAGLLAGQDLEMPGNGGLTDADVLTAARDGRLALPVLDRAVRRNLELTARVMDHRDPAATVDVDAHHRLARRAAQEGMVLLKNDQDLLPIQAKRVAFLGDFARHPRFQGSGSSHITPTRLDDAVSEALRLAPAGTSISWAAGYDPRTDQALPDLVAEAQRLAADAELAVVFIGLTDRFESEGFDRPHLGIPASHTALLEAVLAVQPRLVVVLSNGAPIDLPWADRVPAILEGYLGGQAWGGAVADLLFGLANPSGRLAETFPRRLEDTPAFLNFPGDGHRVEYREGVFVGYRHWDAIDLEPRFAFGHGLSYTSFAWGPLQLDRTELTATDTLTVQVTVTNSGRRPGAEVVQLYVGDPEASVRRPKRELKAFAKVFLEPGQTQTVRLELGPRAFAFWSVEAGAWVVEAGVFELAAGASSRDLRQLASVTVVAGTPLARRWDATTTLGELADHPSAGPLVRELLVRVQALFGSYEAGSAEEAMMANLAAEMPLHKVFRFGPGFPPEALGLLLGVVQAGESPAALERLLAGRGPA